jgi:hypothetical protein
MHGRRRHRRPALFAGGAEPLTPLSAPTVEPGVGGMRLHYAKGSAVADGVVSH